MIKRLMIALCALALLLPGIRAQAYNRDYLQKEKWLSDSKITAEAINRSSGEYEICGDFKYYIDNENFCLYVCFSLSGSNLPATGGNEKIAFEFTLPRETYCFEVAREGIVEETGPEAKQVFDAAAVFTPADGTYIAAVQYRYPDKEDVAAVGITFNDGVRSYRITDEPLYIDHREETTGAEAKPTTTKKPKTTKEKTTKKKRGSSRAATTRKFRAFGRGAATTEGETKFEASGALPADEESATTAATAEENAPPVAQQVAARFSPTAKITAAGAGVLALAGIAVLLYGILTKPKKEKEE